MDDETFWDLIEGCRRAAPGPDERLEWLRERLAGRTEPEILRFQAGLDRVLTPTLTWDLWGAADRIMGWCSDDSFFYFRLWLVGLGREGFDSVVRDPDALADVPAVRRLVGRSPDVWDEDEWLEWEELDYVAEGAYAHVTGRTADDFYAAMESLGGDDDELADPAGERWDAREDAESHRRLPRLSALFPLPAAS
ncbi:DUF4240 domain-containing protein [Streptomyces caniscabiei]|uniref:DUF4240 domain-containing protein n=1 Tax=Streptomyces caniscabiei TaxID=2746961 RepID=A0A927L788_9ACTN|nr:DUF4240 domain-containing protein [Streptomyces caniscabiei]MBD9703718.1 DUF4240 domain-containing protein [Streptomyces caniscabiei]MBD9726820.1 DUF4240 domain-containing protein [Streptomyces caniscabiei]MDX3515472.1 DUF4240 domain-containing protein [Streptomyces caniscabiei]MDX3724624.1 DUF4240 domain-containing protein [Streptomyces caniscabiei]MDX3733104.1 DUF4240 domain-containing protein [Streptomyces caniscabiei]